MLKHILGSFIGVSLALLLCIGFYFTLVDRRVEQQGDRALQVARMIWGRTACSGAITMRSANLPGNQGGEASYLVTKLPNGDRITSNCVLTVDSRNWSARRYCAVVVHEYGHLLGRDHVDNPRSIMYPTITRNNIPGMCQRSSGAVDTV